MIYLSRLDLNPRSRQARAELADLYQMHRTLSRAFPAEKEGYAEARCLFRVETGGRSPLVLVQSRTMPDWEYLKAEGAYLAGMPAVKEVAPQFHTGQRLRFRLRANPTVKRNGRREPIVREPDRIAWIRRKGETGGFAVARLDVEEEPWVKAKTGKGCQAQMSAVRFDGVLVVCSPDELLKTVECGIGSGKGFGFGLLSLARA